MSLSSTEAPRSTRRRPVWEKALIGVLVIAGAGLLWLDCGGIRLFFDGPEEASGLPALMAKEGTAAPDLDGGVAWLNTAGPIQLADLKGHFVLLDFWTLCCINCIHNLPDLAKLESVYRNILVVIGVHTPKFPNEKETESIRKAVLRYEIAHPVVNDANTAIWTRFGVHSWPTMILIDPEGNVCWAGEGEGQYNVLEAKIGELAKVYRARKSLDERPLRFELARSTESGDSPLFFPGKVLADQKSKRLFIADSTHHRIVITDLEGKKIAIAGTGVSGLNNGPFDKATFSDPQGMALAGDTLYVADRKNHEIRGLDLKNQTVRTVAGTGTQNRTSRNRGGPALTTGLNSPWDLLLHGKKLFIAMAGHHQIWTLDLDKSQLEPYAGSGRESIGDGPLLGAQFAQPSGLTTDGRTLWVADSETSSIRAMPINGLGEVDTVVGMGLFDFGDVDGVGNNVRLQHALGVAYKDGKLFVADTYNSKIKVIDPATRACKTLVGDHGGWLTAPTFSEPGGLSFAGDKLYVADTNGHRIRVVDIATGNVTTLQLQGVEAPKAPAAK